MAFIRLCGSALSASFSPNFLPRRRFGFWTRERSQANSEKQIAILLGSTWDCVFTFSRGTAARSARDESTVKCELLFLKERKRKRDRQRLKLKPGSDQRVSAREGKLVSQ